MEPGSGSRRGTDTSDGAMTQLLHGHLEAELGRAVSTELARELATMKDPSKASERVLGRLVERFEFRDLGHRVVQQLEERNQRNRKQTSTKSLGRAVCISLNDVPFSDVTASSISSQHSGSSQDSTAWGSGIFFQLPPPEEIEHALHLASEGNSATNKLRGLQSLCQLSPGDMLWSPHWKEIESTLLRLSDSAEEEVFGMAFDALAAVAHSALLSSPEQIACIYTELVTHIIASCVRLENSDSAQARHHILKRVRLMNAVQQTFPKYWLRVPQECLEQVVISTLDMYTWCGCRPIHDRLTTVDFLLAVNPSASWCQGWARHIPSRRDLFHGLASRGILHELAALAIAPLSPDGTAAAAADGDDEMWLGQRDAGPRDAWSSWIVAAVNPRVGPSPPGAREYLMRLHATVILAVTLSWEEGRRVILEDHIVGPVVAALADNVSLVGPTMGARGDGLAEWSGWGLCQLANAQALGLSNLVTSPIVAKLLQQLEDEDTDGPGPALVYGVILSLVSTARGRRILYELSTPPQGTLTADTETDTERGRDPRWSVAILVANFLTAIRGALHGEDEWIEVLRAACKVWGLLLGSPEGLQFAESFEFPDALAHYLVEAGSISDVVASILCDTLLQVGWTPRGASLLSELGVLDACLFHLYKVFTSSPVSFRDRREFAALLLQICNTEEGFAAMCDAGFLDYWCGEFWGVLERENVALILAGEGPSECRTVLRMLARLLSSPYALSVLSQREALVKRTLGVIVERLILVDTPEKRTLLWNFADEHHAGLILLQSIAANLSSFVILESMVGNTLRETLALLQRDCILHDTEQTEAGIIIDESSLLRNDILMSTCVVGGPTERKGKTFSAMNGVGPLVSSFPSPEEFSKGVDCMLNPFLESVREENRAYTLLENLLEEQDSPRWLGHLRSCLTSGGIVLGLAGVREIVPQILLRASQARLNEEDIQRPDVLSLLSPTPNEPHPATLLASEVAVAYATNLHITSSDLDDRIVFAHAIEQIHHECKSLLGLELSSTADDFESFDWFGATLLMILGDVASAHRVLMNLAILPGGTFLWPWLGREYGLLPSFYQFLEIVVRLEMPELMGAIGRSGMALSIMCARWLEQCFWNYLDFGEIATFILLCTTMGTDYQVYVVVAALRCLRERILGISALSDLHAELAIRPLHGFRIMAWMRYMQTLEERFRPTYNEITSHIRHKKSDHAL